MTVCRREQRRDGMSRVGMFGLIAVFAGAACSGGSDSGITASDQAAVSVTEASATTVAPTAVPTTTILVLSTVDLATLDGVDLMPDVLCMDLQEAQNLIQDNGVFFSRSQDASGEGRRQIFDRNWIVVAQEPEPGAPIGERDPMLSVLKDDEVTDCG